MEPSKFELSERELTVARRDVVFDGLCSRLMDILTGGVFLAGLGLHLGADSFAIGVLASLPFLAQVAQLPAVKLLRHVWDRRLVVILAAGVARFMLLVIAVLLLRDTLTVGLLVVVVGVMAFFTVVSAAAWNWWMRDLLPRSELGRFFAFRLQLTTLLAAGGLLLGGLGLDWFVARAAASQGYAVLFLIGAGAGGLGLVFLARTPHRRPPPSPSQSGTLRLIVDSLRGAANRRLLVAVTLVAATLTVALPFVAVFMLRSLGYSFVLATAVALVSQIGYAGSLRGWGYLSDHFGNRPILLISTGILVSVLFVWALVQPATGWAVLAAVATLHFLSGFAIGGIELTSHNILLKTAPEHGAPAYLAGMGLTKATAAGVATISAGALWQWMGADVVIDLGPALGIPWALRGFHILCLVSGVLGLAALVALRRIQEEGGAPVFQVARAMRREVRQLSSIAGIRAFVHVVSYVVEFVAAPKQRPAESERDSVAPKP